MFGVVDLAPRLEAAIAAAMLLGEPENPVYRVTQTRVLRESVEPDDAQAFLIKKLDYIESFISDVKVRGLIPAPPNSLIRESAGTINHIVYVMDEFEKPSEIQDFLAMLPGVTRVSPVATSVAPSAFKVTANRRLEVHEVDTLEILYGIKVSLTRETDKGGNYRVVTK